MENISVHRFLSMIALFMLPSMAASQEAALYENPPPADAAFVRFIGPFEDSVDWGNLKFDITEGYSGEYFIVHAPQVGLAPGDFVTILPPLAEMLEPAKAISKVTLGLVNLSGDAITLKTGDGSVDIISGVDQFDAGWREVNPITIDVQVYVNDAPTGQTVSLNLIRGEHKTLVYLDDGSVVQVDTAFMRDIVE